jgi:hypothetical protein
MTLRANSCDGHFENDDKIYLTVATNQEAIRYNNVMGGYLEIDADSFEKKFGVALKNYSTHTHIMSKVNQFAFFGAFFLISNPKALGTEEEIQTAITETGLNFEPVVKAANGSVNEAIAKVQKWATGSDKNGLAWAAKLQEASYGIAFGQAVSEIEAIFALSTEDALALCEMLSAPETREAAITTLQGYINDTVTAEELSAAWMETTVPQPTVDPAALQQALVENQVPLAEGQPAETISEEAVSEEAVSEEAVSEEAAAEVPAEQIDLPAPVATPLEIQPNPDSFEKAAKLQNVLNAQFERRIKTVAEQLTQVHEDFKEVSGAIAGLFEQPALEKTATDAEITE